MELNNKIHPAFKGNNNCIIFSANDSFVPCLSVMLKSIIETAISSKKYDIIIFNKDISQKNQSIITSMTEEKLNICIRFVDVNSYIKGIYFYTANRKNITEETYYRLLIPWILDETYIRALYLDGDMVVLSDITDLFNIELEHCIIAAVRDYWGICNCYIPNDSMREYRKSIGIENIDNYVISATILFDVGKFRNFTNLNNVLKLIESKNWKQHDQDVLNVLMQNRIKFISPIWGYMSDYGNNKYLPYYMQEDLAQCVDKIKILHFGGARKPWSKLYVENHMVFWNYAYKTPYFNELFNMIKSSEYKCFVAYQLSKGHIDFVHTEEGIDLFFKGNFLEKYSNMIFQYHQLSIHNAVLHIEGIIGFYCASYDSKIKVCFKINGKNVNANRQFCCNSYTVDNELKYRAEYFILDYEILNIYNNEYDVELLPLFNGYRIKCGNIRLEKYFPLSNRYFESYYQNEGWVAKIANNILTIKNTSNVIKYELKFINEIIHNGGLANIKSVLPRISCYFIKKLINKPVWLISDRLSKADDNGEALFKYINNINSSVSSYFVISNKSKSYNELKKYGKVLKAYSWKHKFLQLIANAVVTSQTDEVFRNPFGKYSILYKDYLSKTKYIFLQHGIISTDLSRWLCRQRQAINGFITSSNAERDLILCGHYNYIEKEVWLTGLPRFDYLKDSKEKLITIQPTWRRYLAIHQNHKTGVWDLVPNFSESKYAVFYRNLLCNDRLLRAAERYGYKIQFKIHPSFLSKADAFKFPPSVSIVDDSTSYRDIYEKSSLLVTDYSSSVYDFLYLRKPIIYCQFDKDDFFNGEHMGIESSFNFENDGFGEVEYTLETTVERIIEYMENDCALKDIYKERIDNFFAFNDRKNCERVYNAILSMDKK